MSLRGDLAVDDLLRIVLVLVIVWLVLQIVGLAVGTLRALFNIVQPLLALVILVILVLWLLDRI